MKQTIFSVVSLVTTLGQTESELWKREHDTKRQKRQWKKEMPRVIEIKLRQLWMKDLGRAGDEKRGLFRTERERRKEVMKEWVDVFDLELTGFLSQNKSATPLARSFSPSLITFVTVNQLWLRHWNMRSGLIKTLFQPHHRNLYGHINTVTRTRHSNSQSNHMTDRNQYTYTQHLSHASTHATENKCLELVLLT